MSNNKRYRKQMEETLAGNPDAVFLFGCAYDELDKIEERQAEQRQQQWEQKASDFRTYMRYVLQQAGILEVVEWKESAESSAFVMYNGVLLWLWFKSPYRIDDFGGNGEYGFMLYVSYEGHTKIIPLAFQEWIENEKYSFIVHALAQPRHFMDKPILFVLPPPDLSQILAEAIETVMHPKGEKDVSQIN